MSLLSYPIPFSFSHTPSLPIPFFYLPILSPPIPSCPVLSCPVLFYPFLSCSLLSCLAVIEFVVSPLSQQGCLRYPRPLSVVWAAGSECLGHGHQQEMVGQRGKGTPATMHEGVHSHSSCPLVAQEGLTQQLSGESSGCDGL